MTYLQKITKTIGVKKMERFLHQHACLTCVAFVLSVSSATALAVPGNEAYFYNDIDAAVEHAQRTPAQAHYVGHRWYNRTTSRSIELPPMLNRELDEKIIEGALGPTAAGEAAAAQAQQPVRNAAMGRANNENSFDDNKPLTNTPSEASKADTDDEVVVREISYEGNDFKTTSRDIRANVTIRAFSRP